MLVFFKSPVLCFERKGACVPLLKIFAKAFSEDADKGNRGWTSTPFDNFGRVMNILLANSENFTTLVEPHMSPQPVSLAQAETTKKLIAGVWRRNRTLVLSRLEFLECTASAVATQSVTPVLLEEALSILHKLAGSLGMFGFGEGTLLVRVLEQQLESAAPNAGVMFLTIDKLRVVLFPDTLAGTALVASN